MDILINKILDKVNHEGKHSLSFDEKNYLKQYNNSSVDHDLEKWLISDDESTFDENGEKLLYDEFDYEEDLFFNYRKLKRVISKVLNKKPFSNNADWCGGDVWNVDSKDNNTGKFIYLGDDDLVLLERKANFNNKYEDAVLIDVTNAAELHKLFLSLKSKCLSENFS